MSFEHQLRKAIKTPQLNFYAKIDDHGVRWGDTGQILAQWRCTVASSVALDLPDWSRSIFSVVDFMSCITVAK